MLPHSPASTSPRAPSSAGARELDNCRICGGYRGGLLGNENVIEGLVVCDYCTARRPSMSTGQVSAKTVAMHCFGLSEQLLLLSRRLNDPCADVGTPLEIIARMQSLLQDVSALPYNIDGRSWLSLPQHMPARMVQVLVRTRDGVVRESIGATVQDLYSAAKRMGEDCAYTHWTAIFSGRPPQASPLPAAEEPIANAQAVATDGSCAPCALTAHDAEVLATFGKALRANACPYCARPIVADKVAADIPARLPITPERPTVELFSFNEIPSHARARWFVKRGAVTERQRGFASKDAASDWITEFGYRLDWRSGFVFRLRGDTVDMHIVDAHGTTARA
jgi:hypothetical protein